MKRGIRLLFPTIVYEENLIESGRITEDYCDMLKDAIDGMRKKDPVGRNISNAYSGWQSNDGCERHPAFTKLMRVLKDIYNNEICGFHAINNGKIQIGIGNSWANINDTGAWNKPHLHNGCWYSGAFYVKGDGDEGDFVAIDKDPKVVSDFPNNVRQLDTYRLRPTTGSLILFPSAMMHMVEPNRTEKDRYSISFNVTSNKLSMSNDHANDVDPDWNHFPLDDNYDIVK